MKGLASGPCVDRKPTETLLVEHQTIEQKDVCLRFGRIFLRAQEALRDTLKGRVVSPIHIVLALLSTDDIAYSVLIAHSSPTSFLLWRT